jgi:hypothetical protein
MPVVHAAVPQANARWKALFQRDFGMDCRIRSGNDEREERKKKYRRRNADRRKALLPCLTGTAAPGAPGAHLSAFHRGSRPKESFIARDSAPGFCFLGRGLSVEWALPTPAYPSPAKSSRPGRSAEGLMPNAARRVASPRAGAALAPGIRPAGRSPSDWARFEAIGNRNGDDGQHHSDMKFRHPEVRAVRSFSPRAERRHRRPSAAVIKQERDAEHRYDEGALPLGSDLRRRPLTRIAAQSDLSPRSGERKAQHNTKRYVALTRARPAR